MGGLLPKLLSPGSFLVPGDADSAVKDANSPPWLAYDLHIFIYECL